MVRNALREYDTVSVEPGATSRPDAPAQGMFDGASNHVGVDIRRVGWIRPLAGEYAHNFSRVARFYAGDPTSPAAWHDAITRVQRAPRLRREVAEVLGAQQARRGAPSEARMATARLSQPGTVAVVTGQQAGAFGGPMYTLLKAITAIQLARRAAAEHALEIVTIFWIDAEDHDWEEVASCTVLDAAFQPHRITLAEPERAGELPIGALALNAQIEQSLDALQAALARTEFTEAVMASLRAAYRPGTGMAEAFATWLEALLGRYGLIVFESSDPAAKPLAADVFARELRSPGRTAGLAAAAGNALGGLGHRPQVEPQPDSLSLFYLDSARRPIRRAGDRFVVGDATHTAESLAAEAQRSPTRFSPNVLLRPIVQDTLFPTICYVAGPSELAYHGQLGGVYDEFGVPRPLIFPRASATLVDSASARFMRRYHVRLEDLQPQDESVLNRLLKSQLPESVEQALRQADEAVRESMTRVVAAMPAVDPTLAGAARTTLGRMEHDLRGLHDKVIQAAKRRDETLRRQFTHAQVQAFPMGQPQERTLAVIFFLNRYGPALVDRLLEELPAAPGQHWMVNP
jgi:bacillithiol biosynthesis cysteine-adding enzyme BshC